MPEWNIKIADWLEPSEQAAIRASREQVYIIEQNVSEELEWDGLDEECLQLLVSHPKHGALATARLCYNNETGYGHIGRMSVLKEWREQGIGHSMLDMLIEHANMQQISHLELNAQTHAMKFYTKHGFDAYGEEFLDAGIPHYAMKKDI